jgi:azurin
MNSLNLYKEVEKGVKCEVQKSSLSFKGNTFSSGLAYIMFCKRPGFEGLEVEVI